MINTERLCMGCMNDSGGERICPICNYDSATKNPQDCLPQKFIINNRYLIGKVTATDGEGISYIGWDNLNDGIVTVKEYFPINFAHRNPDKTVSIIKGGEYTFNEGLLEFKEIYSQIMNSELTSLIDVVDVFEENGTVYSVSSKISGITLEEFLEKNGGRLKWEQARALFLPLFDTVKGMNDLGIVHGGISTKTIIVCRDGKLRISDYQIKNMRKADSGLETEIFDGFAAVEQYGFEDMTLGSNTDVYGLCATLFRVIIGMVPPSAADRINNDSMSIPSRFAEELPHHVLSALANGLQVLQKDRTKDIETLKNELVYGEMSEPVVKKINKEVTNTAAKPKKKKNSAKYLLLSALCTALVFIIIAAVLVFGVFKDEIFGTGETQMPSSSSEVNAPVVDQIGDIESGAEVTAKLYDIPKLNGKYYSDIIEDKELTEKFEFVITDKNFCNDHPKGTVCSQDPVSATAAAKKGTKISLVLSLGPSEVKVANLKGLTETEAKIELLKQGFLYNNIEIEEKYDKDKEPGVVIDQSPKYNTSVSTDVKVTVYINAYKGESGSEDENYSE